jgi:hypothetical protein
MSLSNNFPTIAPSLNLSFALTKALDPRITFTRTTTATYFDANGILQTAASGVARFDHNPTTGESLGLLIEEQRTNLALYSNNFTDASWVKTNITAALDQVGPDNGINSASSLTATAGNGTVLQTVTSASAARFETCYVKRITGTGVVEMTMDNGSTWTAVTVTSAWTRVSIPSQTVTNPVVGFRLVTDTDAIAVYGFQIENGAFPTSYIATTSASVTRNADAASMTGTNFSSWYRADEGTLYAEHQKFGTSTFQRVAGMSDGGFDNRINLGYGSGSPNNLRTQINVSGVTQAALALASPSAININYKVALAYAVNDFASVLNAGTVQTDTSGTIPVVSRFNIGIGDNTISNPLNGTIKKLSFYPARLTNAQLQALTS